MKATVTPLGIACCAEHCGSQVSQLGRTTDCFSPLATYLIPSLTMTASLQGGLFHQLIYVGNPIPPAQESHHPLHQLAIKKTLQQTRPEANLMK